MVYKVNEKRKKVNNKFRSSSMKNKIKKITFQDVQDFIMDVLKIIIGSAVMAAGIELFLVPNQLSTGGFSGIATIGYYMFGAPVGTVMLIINIPLFCFAYFRVGKKFFAKALIGTAVLSLFLNVFANFEPITLDRFLAFLYGSVVVGIGTAIVLKANGSTGGTDLLANVIKTFNPYLKTGTLIVITDVLIVGANVIYFKDIEVGLYSALAIYVMGKTLDVFFEGINFAKKLVIISSKWEEIADRIGQEIHRGVTAIDAEGMYKREPRKVLMCVMSRVEVREARKIIEEIDKNAFIVITNAREVYGEGFRDK